ncbi:ABC transporter ATP-binding protein [Fusibacter ferrireducens]|uniref:ABC transporter ATP-binding protein n=1 Tax=Fusibacter ferrireducens TaxID=2785058 RepID=A0ABR9ZST6_9FIRM|nr:ABC transporter ATP-binding protein [Fusibacter ferrireducens]MBF4693532.1 ABC transporter ATP-binding protein [Fusibacter ferrireducens]
MDTILKTHNLTKAFNGVEVISNVNMTIRKGEIYGFLGPNGAGKTTLMKLILNLIKPTSGQIELFDEALTYSSYEFLNRIGSIIETAVFYDRLTGYENLELHCEYMGYHEDQAIEKALQMVDLAHIGKKKVKEYSLGMKQRLALARAIITKPELLILDEPINGLDPVGIKDMRNLLKKLNKEYGVTILISSHIISEIEQIADKIGIIKNGHLIQEIKLEDTRMEMKTCFEIVVNDSKKAALILLNTLNLENFKVIDDTTIRLYDFKHPQTEIMNALIQNGIQIDAFLKKKDSLEDYFLKNVIGGETSA